jgi:hypothetical protein
MNIEVRQRSTDPDGGKHVNLCRFLWRQETGFDNANQSLAWLANRQQPIDG